MHSGVQYKMGLSAVELANIEKQGADACADGESVVVRGQFAMGTQDTHRRRRVARQAPRWLIPLLWSLLARSRECSPSEAAHEEAHCTHR